MQLDSLLAPKWRSSSFLLLVSQTTAGTAASNRLPIIQFPVQCCLFNIGLACYKADTAVGSISIRGEALSHHLALTRATATETATATQILRACARATM